MGAYKLMLCLLLMIVMFATSLFGQFTDSPGYMVKDSAMVTIAGTTTIKTVVKDFYFNHSNDSTKPSYADLIDVNFYYTQKSPISYPDSAVVDVWGIVKKFLKLDYSDPLSNDVVYSTFYVDSTRIGVFTEANKMEIIPLDAIPLYDGIRIVISNHLVDADTIYTYTNIRFKR